MKKNTATTQIVFFGTAEFAVPILEILVKEGWPIKLVVTQPDEKVGRHQTLQPTPVKIAAQKLGLTVKQFKKLDINWKLEIGNWKLSIVCAYGKLLPKEVLDIPKHGTLNIHPSLLPKYRGPAPMQNAILNGDRETGVTIMLMDKEMDHGPILAQETMAIKPEETYPELANRLAQIGGQLLIKTLLELLNNKIKPQSQNHSQATYTKILKREDGKIDWNHSAEKIYNQYRALQPWPGVYCEVDERLKIKRLKILRLRVGEATKKQPGEFITDNKKLAIACGNNQSVEILELQPEGKKPMMAIAFKNGYLKK